MGKDSNDEDMCIKIAAALFECTLWHLAGKIYWKEQERDGSKTLN